MADTTGADAGMVGRGNREGARLFREWYDELSRAAADGRGGAYAFVMGSLGELLRTFDLPLVLPEINSLQTAVRHVAPDYLNQAEDYGYSPDICGYVKADVATQLREGQLPMGRIPRPAIAIATNACNTYIKWAEIWERMHGCPVVTLDIPGSRSAGRATWPGDPAFENDRRYVAAQLRELIPVLERVSGVRFDPDRLREHLSHAEALSRSWSRVLELNRARPAPFNALSDGTVFLGVANAYRGTAAGARYFEDLLAEMDYKSANGIGTTTAERFRLVFVGVPCYPLFRRFNEMFTEREGGFVHSTYLWFASGGAHAAYEPVATDPLERLAENVLVGVRDAMDSMFFHTEPLLRMVKEYEVDGVVYHPIKSCRTVSTGLADSRRALLEAADVPSLFLESDMMDRRVVSEAQLKNRIDAFFEGLSSRRHQTAIAR